MTADANAAAPLRLGISIVCYHPDLHLLARTLTSLQLAISVANEVLPLTTQLTLIDNGADAPALQALLAESSLAAISSVISNSHNVGFGAANNQAVLMAQSDYHLVLNPDVELAEDALLQGLQHLQQHAPVVAVSPSCRNGAGNIEHLCKRYPTVLDLLLRGFAPGWLRRAFDARLARYEYRELANTLAATAVTLISGCFMLCRTATLQQAGGFDPRYFLYFEDFSLSLALAQHGTLHYLPSCRIVHHGGGAARKGWLHIRLFVTSAYRFYQQHGWRWW
jgi:GT2 family glycosyltransferase